MDRGSQAVARGVSSMTAASRSRGTIVMSYWDWGYYKPKPRIKAKGGIKSQSKRGAFGESWWAKRWIAALESFNIGARLGRGRSYARSGQVLSIDIGKGVIKSKVQGSRPKPYDVTIKVKTLSDADWKNLAGSLSTQALFAAKLLAGEDRLRRKRAGEILPVGVAERF